MIFNDYPSLTIVNDNPFLTIVNDNPSLTIFNDDPSWTIVNDDTSLTIVNEERRNEETDRKGIGTYHWVVLKKISRSFSSPQLFNCM